MLIALKSLSPVLVMISSMPVPISNRFYATRANSGKIRIFLVRILLSRPRSMGNPLYIEDKILIQKLEIFVTAHGEDFVILACTVLIGLKFVTDGWTDV